MKNIVIIWAWAAGLMAASTILEDHSGEYSIHLFDKNISPWKKVILSWWWRCNVTTSIEDKKLLATKYTRGWGFIRKAMWRFSPRKCQKWFESHGVPLKIQEDFRVFPVSDDGRDIVGVFEDIFAKNRDRVLLHYGEGVSRVSIVWPRWDSSIDQTIDTHSSNLLNDTENNATTSQDSTQIRQGKYLITTTKSSYEADILVITTWGNAYGNTWSTGDGYAFARALWHRITELWPSLSSFLTEDSWLHALSGLAFQDAKIGNLLWPLLLTHFGISGPLAFMISSEYAWEKIEKWNPRSIFFSPIASMNLASWEDFLKDQFQSHPKKFIISILSEKLPRRFVEAFIAQYFPHREETFVWSLSRTDREQISRLLWVWIPLTLLERRPGDEFVTAGGVDTDDLDSETMQSKIHKNLYFAGEILNVDGYTWGFSLQICWASGYVVGRNIAFDL